MYTVNHFHSAVANYVLGNYYINSLHLFQFMCTELECVHFDHIIGPWLHVPHKRVSHYWQHEATSKYQNNVSLPCGYTLVLFILFVLEKQYRQKENDYALHHDGTTVFMEKDR